MCNSTVQEKQEVIRTYIQKINENVAKRPSPAPQVFYYSLEPGESNGIGIGILSIVAEEIMSTDSHTKLYHACNQSIMI